MKNQKQAAAAAAAAAAPPAAATAPAAKAGATKPATAAPTLAATLATPSVTATTSQPSGIKPGGLPTIAPAQLGRLPPGTTGKPINTLQSPSGPPPGLAPSHTHTPPPGLSGPGLGLGVGHGGSSSNLSAVDQLAGNMPVDQCRGWWFVLAHTGIASLYSLASHRSEWWYVIEWCGVLVQQGASCSSRMTTC